MPLPKDLRRPVRQLSGSSSSLRRKPCRVCNNLDPRGHPSSVYQSESSKGTAATLSLVLDAFSLSRTKDPTEGGCRFCNVLIHALDAFLDGWRGTRQRVNVELMEKGTIKVSVDGEKWMGELVEIYAASSSQAPWPTLGSAHHVPINSGSDDTFNFARRCIQDCLTNPKHVACRPLLKSATTTPKRLLDVGRVTSPIRLIDTQGKATQYCALSHCWGSGPTLAATKANWQKLASNVSFEALPPLFQDAVIITRQLGLRYLWVDSLCIIQDSVRDWETESSKMGAIYENSYVTISATGSGDGNARCLVERRKPVKINYTNTTGKEFALRARKIADQHPNVKEGEPAKPAGPLMTRAWVLQEHVLSTRVLHYTATDLLFECKTSYRCECMPSRRTYPTTPSLIPKAVAKKGRDKDALWSAWHRILEQYSKRDLTVPNDKLPAISGIAGKIKEATGSSYIAGLWKSNLSADLLWSATTPSSSSTAHYALEKYRAPSFSWASLNVPVSFYTLDDDERETSTSTITLLSSSIKAGGLNPLGAVSGASLKVRGPTITALLSSMQKEDAWEYTLLIKGTSAIHVSHDCLLLEEDLATSSEGTTKTVRRAHPGAELSQFKAPVLCLSVARYDTWMSGLVLGISDRGNDSWERLGTFAAGMEGFQKAEEKDVVLI